MINNFKEESKQLTLAIHSTDNSFGFGYRKKNDHESDKLFIKKFNNDLCNNLVVDFNNFIPKEILQKVNKISVSIGPANFNASRLVVVLAKTISQQMECPLNSFSSFEIMAKRIASKNNIFHNKQSFWIYKELKRKGFLAGKYEVYRSQENGDLSMRETILPKVVQELECKELVFRANYEDEQDLIELLNLSNNNCTISNLKTWQKVVPLYPISPFN